MTHTQKKKERENEVVVALEQSREIERGPSYLHSMVQAEKNKGYGLNYCWQNSMIFLANFKTESCQFGTFLPYLDNRDPSR